MKTLIFTLAFGGMLAGGAMAQPVLLNQTKPKAIAAALIDRLGEGDFNGAGRDFDDNLKLNLPPEKLKAAWRSITAMAGPYKQQLQVRAENSPQGTMVTILCDFTKFPMESRILVSADLRIKSFWCAPAVTAPPGYTNSALFTEEPLSFAAQGATLNGTLTLPKGDGPFKALLLVHGSGPHDRDETIGPNKPFRDIAAGLASRNIAVFRYDKRRAYPTGVTYADITVKEEVLYDALAAAAALRSDRRVNPEGIYVLGHSLGGQLAPWIAKSDDKIAGIVVAAGPVGSFGETVLRQSIYLAELDGTVTDEERAAIEALKKQAALADGPELNENTPAKDLPLGLNPKYLLSLRRCEPVTTAAGLQIPLLVLQGERDYQVTMEDLRSWKDGLTGKTNAVLKSYPGLNHLFMRGEGPGNPNEYMLPGNVTEEVITDISAWLK